MRLFVGIPLPKRIRERIYDGLSEWRREIKGIKYVEEENLHITLKFIGEADKNKAERIKELLRTIHFHPIKVRLEGIGAFPTKGRPRVIWIGIKQGFNEIVALSKQIDELLVLEGIPREAKEFHPHVTIGRVRNAPYSKIREKLSAFGEKEFGEFTVKEFTLFKSTLTPRGPIYEKLSSYGVKE